MPKSDAFEDEIYCYLVDTFVFQCSTIYRHEIMIPDWLSDVSGWLNHQPDWDDDQDVPIEELMFLDSKDQSIAKHQRISHCNGHEIGV